MFYKSINKSGFKKTNKSVLKKKDQIMQKKTCFVEKYIIFATEC